MFIHILQIQTLEKYDGDYKLVLRLDSVFDKEAPIIFWSIVFFNFTKQFSTVLMLLRIRRILY